MKTSTVSTVLTLISLTTAATVTLQPTRCLNQNVTLDPFTIEVGTLVAKDLPAVCGLSIASASDVDVKSLTCRAFKDAAGKEPGSAEFTVESPALIATNPVQEKSLLCEEKDGSDDSPTPSPAGNSTETPDVVTQVTFITASLTGGATQGTAGPSSNVTVPSVTGGPSAQPSNPRATGPTGPAGPQETGAGSRVAISAAAVAVGFAVLLL